MCFAKLNLRDLWACIIGQIKNSILLNGVLSLMGYLVRHYSNGILSEILLKVTIRLHVTREGGIGMLTSELRWDWEILIIWYDVIAKKCDWEILIMWFWDCNIFMLWWLWLAKVDHVIVLTFLIGRWWCHSYRLQLVILGHVIFEPCDWLWQPLLITMVTDHVM